MTINEIREMTPAELDNELLKQKNELFNLRFQNTTGQLENPLQMKEIKKSKGRFVVLLLFLPGQRQAQT